MLVEEVGKGTMADIVKQASNSERLDDQPLAGNALSIGRERRPERWVEGSCPEPCFVHHAQAVGEA